MSIFSPGLQRPIVQGGGRLPPPQDYALFLNLLDPGTLEDGGGNRLTPGSGGATVAKVYDPVTGALMANQTSPGSRTTWGGPGGGLQGNGGGHYPLVTPIVVTDAAFVSVQRLSSVGTSGTNVAVGGSLGESPYVSLHTGGILTSGTKTRRSNGATPADGVYVTTWRSDTRQLRRNGLDIASTPSTLVGGGNLTQLMRWFTTAGTANTAGNDLLYVVVYTRLPGAEEWADAERRAALTCGVSLG